MAMELGRGPVGQPNLWLELRQAADGWGADRKDNLERVLHRLVCARRLSLARLAHRAWPRDAGTRHIGRKWLAAVPGALDNKGIVPKPSSAER